MRSLIRRLIPVCLLAACAVGLSGGQALASTTQAVVIQDNDALRANVPATMQSFKDLGVTLVKVAVYWNTIAPRPDSAREPRGFNPTNPASYPRRNWSFTDRVVRAAKADGLSVGFMLMGPPPRWAQDPGRPKRCRCLNWKPNDRQFQAFAKVVGTRYSGHYTPRGQSSALPRVRWWSIWNEPNFGPSLSPQASGSGKNIVWISPYVYRGLLEAGWSGLRASGHRAGADTIVFGETAPRGSAGRTNALSWTAYNPRMLQQTLPLIFLGVLYCVGQDGRRFTGRQARLEHCPASAAQFRRENPALFEASGYADHPYAQGTAPDLPTYACGSRYGGVFCSNRRTRKRNPYYADFAAIPRLAKTLDRLQRVYGSRRTLPIWNTEFGYWTKPPDDRTAVGRREAVSPTRAAYYMNWAEYLSYRNPRIASYDQYQLVDPSDGSWADGLLTATGRPKPGYRALMMPLYLPVTAGRAHRGLLVWGAVHPAVQAADVSSSSLSGANRPQVQIQFRPRGARRFETLRTVDITNRRGYFTAWTAFPRSGTVRLAWTDDATGVTEYSRTQAITIR